MDFFGGWWGGWVIFLVSGGVDRLGAESRKIGLFWLKPPPPGSSKNQEELTKMIVFARFGWVGHSGRKLEPLGSSETKKYFFKAKEKSHVKLQRNRNRN